MPLILFACSTTPVSRDATSTIEVTSTSTSVPTLSSTPAVSPIPTITPTATPSYPVSAGTPFPLKLPQITIQNASNLIELARYGGEKDIVLAEINLGNTSIQDTNHGMITSSTTLPPSESHCSTDINSPRGPKVFPGIHGEVAIVTKDDIQVYEKGNENALHVLPLRSLITNNPCPVELHNVRVSSDMKLAAHAYEDAVDIYSLELGDLIASLENMMNLGCFLPIMSTW